MIKQILYKILFVGGVLLLSLPAPSLAGSRHSHREHPQPHHKPHHKRHVQRRDHHRRHRHHVQHHDRHYKRRKHHIQHHDRHHKRHRRHVPHYNGVRIGVHIGRPYDYSPYPHGHHLHVHGPNCPIIVEKHVDYHRPYPAPVWHVHYDTHHTQKTRLRIEVAPHHGDVYVNDRYLGQAHTFRNGSVQVALPAGKHTVQLRYGGTSYTRQVHVKTGATAVVQTHRM